MPLSGFSDPREGKLVHIEQAEHCKDSSLRVIPKLEVSGQGRRNGDLLGICESRDMSSLRLLHSVFTVLKGYLGEVTIVRNWRQVFFPRWKN